MEIKTVSVTDVRKHFNKVLTEVIDGDVYVFMKHGKPVAAMLSAVQLAVLQNAAAQVSTSSTGEILDHE